MVLSGRLRELSKHMIYIYFLSLHAKNVVCRSKWGDNFFKCKKEKMKGKSKKEGKWKKKVKEEGEKGRKQSGKK